MVHLHRTSRTPSHVHTLSGLLTPQTLRAFFVLLLIVAAMACLPASAQLANFGPIDPTNGFPTWYQDKTGVALDMCLPASVAETTWCLLPPIPNGPPEVFPTNWAIENFYFDATSGVRRVTLPNGQTVVVLLIIDLENSFANGFNVVPGDQVVFDRTRIKISPVPYDGDYTVWTPVGKFSFPGQLASQPRGIFFTEDIGLGNVGNFAAALDGRIGPFLLPSATPGGAELPPIPLLQPGQDPFYDALVNAGGATAPAGTGRKYIADPARLGPITGGKGDAVMPDGTPGWLLPNGTIIPANSFHVEGPNGFVFDSTDFTLMGRVFEGPIAGQTTVDRASYAATLSAAGTPSYKMDVYATGAPASQGRIPASPAPATTPTTLSWYDAPCTATLDAAGNPGPPYSAPVPAPALNQMFANGSVYFGESAPASLPPEVCVQGNSVNALGQTITTFTPKAATDQVFITQALFDPSSQTLAVTANSSDQVTPQTMTVTYGPGLSGTMASGATLTVNPLLAVPSTISVLSSASGINTAQMSTGAVAGGVTALPVANNDTASVNENCSATATTTPCATPLNIAVLANDTNAAGGTVAIASAPALGTATVNVDGSVSYTPNLNAFGTDTFTYNVTVGTQVSNNATVTVTITHINQAPTANNDSAGALRGVQNSINVLGNDSDPDGAADLASALIATGNAALGITAGTSFAGPVTFTPPSTSATGTYTFTYFAVDQAGLQSATAATVTVTLSAGEAIVPAKAIYTQNKGRWTLSGTASPAAGQTITMSYVDGTYKVNGACTGNAAGTVIGTAPVDALGNFLYDQILTNTSGVINPSNTLGNSTGFWCTPPKTMHFTSSLSPASANLAISLK